MAAPKMVHSIVGDVTECPICTEVIVDSKVLPCIHTFCLKCLEQFWKNKKPRDEVPCPLCRTPFNIPDGGLSDLPKNCFVEKLLDAQKISNTNQSIPTCDICSSVKNEEDGVLPTAVKYCFDCENNMCEQCVKAHLFMKCTKLHRVVNFEELSTLDKSLNYGLKHCNQHEDEKIKMYCMECESAVCVTCFMIKHNGHKCSDINEVAQGLKDRIRKDIMKTNEMFLKVSEQSMNLEKVLKGFEQDTKETEDKIVRRGNEIKQLVDKHVQSLLHNLNEEKTKRLKEFENVREELQVQKISLESFMKYSQKVLDKAIPSDIACFATELRTRADNLSKMRVVPVGKQVKISFVSSDLNMFTDGSNATSIVGTTSFSGNIRSDNWFLDSGTTVQQNQITTLVKNQPSPTGITINDEEIFIVHYNKSEIQVFDQDTFKHLRNISVPTMKCPWDITISGNILFVAEYSSGLIHRVPLNSSERMNSWSVGFEARSQLSTSKSGNILVTINSKNKLVEFTTAGQLVREIEPLKTGATGLLHAIQMDNDQFLVSQADYKYDLHRVRLFDSKGHLIKSYGGAQGSGPGHLYKPHHLVADVNGFCLVADNKSHRVILLNDELKFVKELIPQSSGLCDPIRICLDKSRKRLFVVEYEYNKVGRIVVFDILP